MTYLVDNFNSLVSKFNIPNTQEVQDFITELSYLEKTSERDSLWRESLENGGVDNWEWYSESLEDGGYFDLEDEG